MGKGTIISGGDLGQYQVQVNYNRSRYDALLVQYNATKTNLESEYDAENLKDTPDQKKLNILTLQILSIEKSIDYLTDNMPDDETLSAWCADLSKTLSGVVGTVEVPGEVGTVQIQPGYDGNAVYDADRDGQLNPTIAQTAEGAFYNLAMQPGWQKWMPTFRYATITAMSGTTADITLDTTTSSQQSIVINQAETLETVSIDYMDCDQVAFNVGDEVLVKFTGQNQNQPSIVGFKDNPRPCGVVLFCGWTDSLCFVWDLENDSYYSGVVDNNGDPVGIGDFPVQHSTISDWYAAYGTIDNGEPFSFEERRTPSAIVSEDNTITSSVNYPEPPPYYCLLFEYDHEIETERSGYGVTGYSVQSGFYSASWDNIYNLPTTPSAIYPGFATSTYRHSHISTDTTPFASERVNYKITSETNVESVRGRPVYRTQDSDIWTKKVDPTDVGSILCDQLGDVSTALIEGETTTESVYTVYSPFDDLSENQVTLNYEQAGTAEYNPVTGRYEYTSETYDKEEYYSNSFFLTGNIGNDTSAPYICHLYYTKFISEDSTDSGPTVYTTHHEETLGYFAKTDGDPADLNPFDTQYRADFSTALETLGTPDEDFEMKYLV